MRLHDAYYVQRRSALGDIFDDERPSVVHVAAQAVGWIAVLGGFAAMMAILLV